MADAEFTAQLEAGVDAAISRMRDGLPGSGERVEAPEPAADDTPSSSEGEPAAELESKGGGEPKDNEPAGLSDALIERAVRAGLELNEINQFPSDGLLEKMVSRMEGRQEEPGSRDGAGSNDRDGGNVPDEESDIPDLDPDIYHEAIVEVVGALKGKIQRLEQQLKSQGEQGQGSWIDQQLKSLDTKVDAAKAAEVKGEFEALRAGYKAAGREVSDKEVFDRAARMVLGEAMAETKRHKQQDAARSRNGQFVSRASSQRAEPTLDARQELISQLERKFFAR